MHVFYVTAGPRSAVQFSPQLISFRRFGVNLFGANSSLSVGRGRNEISSACRLEAVSVCMYLISVEKQTMHGFEHLKAGPRSAVDSASDSRVRDPGFDTRSGHTLSFLLKLIQEGQFSVIGESMSKLPGRVAQSVGHLIRKSEVLGSIPGLATYFCFSFH